MLPSGLALCGQGQVGNQKPGTLPACANSLVSHDCQTVPMFTFSQGEQWLRKCLTLDKYKTTLYTGTGCRQQAQSPRQMRQCSLGLSRGAELVSKGRGEAVGHVFQRRVVMMVAEPRTRMLECFCTGR